MVWFGQFLAHDCRDVDLIWDSSTILVGLHWMVREYSGGVSGFSGMGIVEWWNSGTVEWWNGFFFSLILFACLCTNYYQEYIMLKQRSVQFPA